MAFDIQHGCELHVIASPTHSTPGLLSGWAMTVLAATMVTTAWAQHAPAPQYLHEGPILLQNIGVIDGHSHLLVNPADGDPAEYHSLEIRRAISRIHATSQP